MKPLLLIISLSLTACAIQQPNEDLTLKKAMAYGTVIELNNLSPEQEKNLLIRLYQVPINNENCFVETHGICRYKYLLTVSTFDEYPETNVFALTTRGEVSNITWQSKNQADYAEIILTFNQYTQLALKNNPLLKNKIKKVLLKVSIKKLIEEQQ